MGRAIEASEVRHVPLEMRCKKTARTRPKLEGNIDMNRKEIRRKGMSS